jgi:hypothetical protein
VTRSRFCCTCLQMFMGVCRLCREALACLEQNNGITITCKFSLWPSSLPLKYFRFCRLVSCQCLRLSNFLFWCKNFPLYFQTFEKMLGFLKQQGVMTGRSSILEDLDLAGHTHKDGRLGGNSEILQLGQDPLKLLTTRALEALAQTPDRYGRPAGSMLAPKPTTQKFSNTKAARDLPGPSSQSGHSTLAVPRQPTLSAKPPTSPPRLM